MVKLSLFNFLMKINGLVNSLMSFIKRWLTCKWCPW